MQTAISTERYARVVDLSKRVRWEIDRDVIRGRSFDYSKTFLPAGLSLVDELAFLTPAQKRLLSQVQGRTYAYLFGLVERFIAAKVSDLGRAHAFDDQVAFEAMVRMTDEELKHQELFRRLEAMMAADMPAGYQMTADGNAVAQAVLGASSWAVLALTLDIELFTQAHYRASIEPDAELSELWKDVFKFHWREEAQHAVLDELELLREDARLDKAARDAAVGDLIGLVGAVDGILQAQARADAAYFVRIGGLAAHRRPGRRQRPRGTDRGRGAEGLPLAIHRVGRDGAALPARAVRPARRHAEGPHPGGAGAADLRGAGAAAGAADGSLRQCSVATGGRLGGR